MSALLKQARVLLPELLSRLTVRRESGPIDSVEALCRFVSTRAAFIAQKTLYNYLKTRMGTRYPSMFEDDALIASIDIAKLHVYTACLADLAIFAASQVRQAAAKPLAAEDCRDLALQCFRRGLADNAAPAEAVERFSAAEALAEFERRLAFRDWDVGPQGVDIFSESPAALVRWAPIAPELKRLDREIVENSIKFKWRDVRRDLAKRLDGAAVALQACRLSRATA
jgi:hypothetical protein